MKKNKHPETKTIWLYGKHACLAALKNPKRKCLRVLTTKNALCNLPQQKNTHNTEICSPQTIEKLLPKNVIHQGIATLVEPLAPYPLKKALESNVLLVLDHIVDPHNVGAILRSAAAFGVGGVIVAKDHSPEETPILAKIASGALETIPLIRVTNIARAIDQLKYANFWCIGMDANANNKLHQTNFDGKIAIVLGAEGKGLRQLTKKHCDLLANIPIRNNIESLNVSNAAAIALYEIMVKNEKI